MALTSFLFHALLVKGLKSMKDSKSERDLIVNLLCPFPPWPLKKVYFVRPGIQDFPQLIIGPESFFSLDPHFLYNPDKKVGIAFLRPIDTDNIT
jgi:hypothetical protein